MSELGPGARKFVREDRPKLLSLCYFVWAIAVLIPVLTVLFICTRFDPYPIELALASVAAGAIFFIPGFSLFKVASSYLVTSPEGLEYHILGKGSRAKWTEVVRIGIVPLDERQPERVSGEGIIIRSDLAPSVLVRSQPDRGMFLWYIPLQPFGWHWRETALGREIAHYAPHLLNAQGEQPSRRTYMQEYQ
ncbi:MAG: hypothetical protein M3441_14105 [Chloroflexota bacterium]|nr:hypothetical protein [Chloroflexota bacterium]